DDAVAQIEIGPAPFQILAVRVHLRAADLHVGSVVVGAAVRVRELTCEPVRVALVQLELNAVVLTPCVHGAEVDPAERRVEAIERAVYEVAFDGVVVYEVSEIAPDVADIVRFEGEVGGELNLRAAEPVVKVRVSPERIGHAQRLL